MRQAVPLDRVGSGEAGQPAQVAAPVREGGGASVTITDLTKSYGPVRAVDRISLEIAGGEFVALLGPSGSGKTSLLMTLAGFEIPDSGSIRVADRDITGLAPERRELGMIFQSYALFPHMTVFDNLAFPLATRGLAKGAIRARVHDALDMVQLRALADRKPGQLSGGQQQRVAVARALVSKPGVLLADEPLGALDKNLREHMQLEIKQLQRELGITVIYVTHDQSEALTMADRIAVMRNGRIAQLGTPAQIYESPRSPFVADFIGETNFLSGMLARRGDELALLMPGDIYVRILEDSPRSAGLAPGDAAILAVRPERIVLLDTGEKPPAGATICDGIIEQQIYSGASILYLVRLGGDGGSVIRVRVPNGMVRRSWPNGAEVHAVWSRSDAILYGAGDER